MDGVNLSKVIEESKGKTVDRRLWVKKFCDWIKTAPLTEVQLAEMYKVIGYRLRHAVCHICRQLKPRVNGNHTHPSGDFSKPKVFVCEDCNRGLS